MAWESLLHPATSSLSIVDTRRALRVDSPTIGRVARFSALLTLAGDAPGDVQGTGSWYSPDVRLSTLPAVKPGVEISSATSAAKVPLTTLGIVVVRMLACI